MKILATACVMLLAAMSTAMAVEPGNKNTWTEDQLKTLCYFRAEKDKQHPKRYEICMERNSGKIGKQIQPAAMKELKKADALLAKKATAKTPQQTKSAVSPAAK